MGYARFSVRIKPNQTKPSYSLCLPIHRVSTMLSKAGFGMRTIRPRLATIRRTLRRALCCGTKESSGSSSGDAPVRRCDPDAKDTGELPASAEQGHHGAVSRNEAVISEKSVTPGEAATTENNEDRPATPKPESGHDVPEPVSLPIGPDEGFVDRLVVFSPVMIALRLMETYGEFVKPTPYRLENLSLERCGWRLHPTHSLQAIVRFLERETVSGRRDVSRHFSVLN